MVGFSRRVKLISRCKVLRARGYSLNEIASKLNLPKSTVHWNVKDIILTSAQRAAIEQRRKELCKKHPNPRKGKCIAGRIVLKPKSWSKDLVHIVAHFMFDGSIERYGCVYYNSSSKQIKHMKMLVNRTFGIKPTQRIKDNGVYILSFYYIELVNYVREMETKLLEYIKNGASSDEKRIFLQAFFDDEGSIYYKGSKRRIRGSQDSLETLYLIRDLLNVFNVCSRVDRSAKAIEISGKENLLNFKNEIDFSSGLFINPKRKNSIWKRKLGKRDILTKAINSYLYA